MIGRRKRNMHLGMSRLYEYKGKRKTTYYTITRANKYIHLGDDLRQAKRKLAELDAENPAAGTLADLLDDLLLDREKLVQRGKLAPSTLASNRLEAKELKAVFGKLQPDQVLPKHVWFYLHKARGAESPVRANREVALLSTLFNRAMQSGLCDRNPCIGVERNEETPRDRLVDDAEFRSFCRWARRKGDAGKRASLAASIAYLTGKAQGQILKLTRQQLQPDGILFGKRKRGAASLVGWSRRLRAYVDAAIAMPCDITPMYVIHSQQGTPYTADGFKSIWQRLMKEWTGQGHQRFTFHDLRAKSVTDVTEQGRKASDLTGHRTESVVAKVYDRRRVRKAPAVK